MPEYYAMVFEDGDLVLKHYGIAGMKKGLRRWQNEDGSLTPEGYAHYGIDPNKNYSRGKLNRIGDKIRKDANEDAKENNKLWAQAQSEKDIEKKKQFLKMHQANQDLMFKGLNELEKFRRTKDPRYAKFMNKFDEDSRKEFEEEDNYKQKVSEDSSSAKEVILEEYGEDGYEETMSQVQPKFQEIFDNVFTYTKQNGDNQEVLDKISKDLSEECIADSIGKYNPEVNVEIYPKYEGDSKNPAKFDYIVGKTRGSVVFEYDEKNPNKIKNYRYK